MAKPKLILPEHYAQDNDESVTEDATARAAKQLPDPSGYRILCSIPQIEKAYDSGLLKALEHKDVIEPMEKCCCETKH